MTRIFSWVGLTLLGLLLFLPPLIPVHLPPIGSFWNEWTAGILSVLFWAACWMSKDFNVELPGALIVWILWGVALSAAAFFNKYYMPAAIFHYGIFWFVGALLILGVAELKKHFELSFLLLISSYVMFVSGLFQSVFGFARYAGLLTPISPYLAPLNAGRLAGFLNYPTIQGFSLWLSLFAGLYLYSKGKISTIILAIPSFIIGISIIATGDRSSILYWASMLFVLLCLRLRLRKSNSIVNIDFKAASKGIAWISAALLLAIIVCKPIYNLTTRSVDHGENIKSSSVSHGFERSNFLGIRIVEFKKAIVIFEHHPIFGIGPGNFPYKSFILDSHFKNGLREGTVNTHSHNIVSMIMAEDGAFGLLVLFFGMFCLVRWWWRMGINSESLFVGGIISLFFVFSNLEFPLWYLNFLSIFLVFFVFASPSRSFVVDHPTLKQIVTVGATVVSLMVAANIGVGYYQISTVETSQTSNAKNINTLSSLLGDHVLGPYAGTVIERATNPTAKNASRQLGLANRLAHFLPMPVILVTKAFLLDFLGKEKEACALAEKTANSYPVALEQYDSFMGEYSKKPSLTGGHRPERLGPCFAKGVASWKSQWRN